MEGFKIDSLLKKEAYPHPCKEIKLLQTHLSWIILTGSYAYKIKKPMNLGFQDFTTLEKRHYYCQKEVELNLPFAKDIPKSAPFSHVYIEVVPVIKENGIFKIGKSEKDSQLTMSQSLNPTLVEWAIKMHEFSQERLLSSLLKDNQLTSGHIQKLANTVASFHSSTKILETKNTSEKFGSYESISSSVLENFSVIKSLLPKEALNHNPDLIEKVNSLEKHTITHLENLKSTFENRLAKGFIRATHGDLHLNNAVLIEDTPILFDCIEFNESFRQTDVMADVAFLTMDLEYHNAFRYSQLFINAYLQKTGDYEGLSVYRFYKMYRAMVRSKVALYSYLQCLSRNDTTSKTQALNYLNEVYTYVQLALTYTNNPSCKVFITMGLSGSGKTYISEQFILNNTNCIHITSDVERKRIITQDYYSEEAHRRVYNRLLDLTKVITSCHYDVIIDATFIQKWHRDLFIHFCEKMGYSFTILTFDMDMKKIEINLQKRKLDENAISDADSEVVKSQLKNVEPLNEQECAFALNIKNLKFTA